MKITYIEDISVYEDPENWKKKYRLKLTMSYPKLRTILTIFLHRLELLLINHLSRQNHIF